MTFVASIPFPGPQRSAHARSEEAGRGLGGALRTGLGGGEGNPGASRDQGRAGRGREGGGPGRCLEGACCT